MSDQAGTPIDPPNVEEAPKRTRFVDTLTDDTIWISEFVPLAREIGRQVTLDIYVDSNRVHHLYYVDAIDTDTNTVYLTLNKVYLNDNPIFPLS